jgi:hypothetical protein
MTRSGDAGRSRAPGASRGPCGGEEDAASKQQLDGGGVVAWDRQAMSRADEVIG